MNKLITIIGAAFLLLIFVTYMCTFQVRSTEVAVLKTRGKFTQDNVITEPGLKWKAPWPFQSVVITDKRVRVLEDTYEETQTKDSQNILVTTYTCWKVGDAYKFHITSASERDASTKLKTMIQSEKKSVLAQYTLSDLVNTDKEAFRFEEIERTLRDRVNAIAQEQSGIEVVDLGIRRLSFPKNVTEEIFNRMKKREESKAAKFQAEGQADAQAIVARASAISENILAVSNRLADEIKADAQKKVGEYYTKFDKNPELRLFLDRVEAARRILKDRSTIILDDLDMRPSWLLNIIDGQTALQAESATSTASATAGAE